MFGRFFRKLTIMYNRPKGKNKKFISKQICTFIKNMTSEGVQLKSICMPRVMIMEESARSQDSCTNLINFLNIQTSLTHVDFNNGRTQGLRGLEILESLAAENVQHLMLHNFFQTRILAQGLMIPSAERYMTAMVRFRALRSLSLDLLCINDELMARLADSLDGTLEVFSVFYKPREFLRRISDDSWTFLKRKCLIMRVHFTLDIVEYHAMYIINDVMSSAIPLDTLHFTLNTDWNNERDGDIFHRLSEKYSETLREAIFVIKGPTAVGVRSGILELLTCCNRMERLTLRARFPDFLIMDLIGSILHNISLSVSRSLQSFRATFRGMPLDNDHERCERLNTIYGPLFRDLGVKLMLKIK